MKSLKVTYSDGTVETRTYETYYDATEKARCISTWDDVELIEIYDGDTRLAYCQPRQN